MIDKKIVFVLGARDPEMREIARVLKQENRPFVYAAKTGTPVLPRTAYEADGVVQLSHKGSGMPAVLMPQALAIFVECTVLGHAPTLRIDHHHPGDPGYAMPPDRYMDGASIGQTLCLLEREATSTQRLMAAADHCLSAAYRGQCPGVDPEELLLLRASWRAKVTGRSLNGVIDSIVDLARRVRDHYDIEAGESRFLDPTDIPADLAEAAAYAGCAIRYREFFPDGQLKEMLKGAPAEHIERFMSQHRQQGREVYGNPYRGYAGAYLP